MSTEHFYPENRQQWRDWLQKHHDKEPSVWLLCYKQKSGKPTISWSEAVDEALCFGWIDSTRRSLDDESFIQFFTRRKPKSMWSKINKDKVEQLIKDGRMSEAGLACIEIAKQNGSWTFLDSVEALIVPDDLEAAFKAHPGSKEGFDALAKSARKFLLAQLALAKRSETREKRIADILKQCSI